MNNKKMIRKKCVHLLNEMKVLGKLRGSGVITESELHNELNKIREEFGLEPLDIFSESIINYRDNDFEEREIYDLSLNPPSHFMLQNLELRDEINNLKIQLDKVNEMVGEKDSIMAKLESDLDDNKRYLIAVEEDNKRYIEEVQDLKDYIKCKDKVIQEQEGHIERLEDIVCSTMLYDTEDDLDEYYDYEREHDYADCDELDKDDYCAFCDCNLDNKEETVVVNISNLSIDNPVGFLEGLNEAANKVVKGWRN